MMTSRSNARWATAPLSTTFLKFVFALYCFSNQIGHCKAYRQPLNHRDIAGLWKLTQSKPQPAPSVYYPMKEFTVYPRDKERQMKRAAELLASAKNQAEEEEILLMLKEDGSFQQYAQDENVVVPDKLKYHDDDDAVLERFFGNIKGQWDYVDGKLYLAAERPENIPVPEDTLLVGQVVATSGESLQGNPILMQTNATTKEDIPKEVSTATSSDSGSVGSDDQSTTTTATVEAAASDEDTHLSVPQGEVNVGKFTYPRKHPAFFDQPMFQPRPKGSFQLQQVLGSLNTQSRKEEEENKLIEKFRVKDFYDKLFLLTAHPIGESKPKGNRRWSIKYNKYVEDTPKKSKKQEEDEARRPAMIRVMEVKFFANNTFATVAGLGGNILRGKFDIIGHDRDQLWMQVWRFGFGRSVSGSVYSEGKSLTKEDEKSYWGEISYEDGDGDDNQGNGAGTNPTTNASNKDKHDDESTDGDPPSKRLQVKGSVIYGYGLEPIPVARFIMREATEDDEEEEEDDDDDENFKPPDLDITDGGIDWTDAFQ